MQQKNIIIFSKNAVKPFSNRLCPINTLDALLKIKRENDVHISVTMLQKAVKKYSGNFYNREQLQYAVNLLAKMDEYGIDAITKRLDSNNRKPTIFFRLIFKDEKQ